MSQLKTNLYKDFFQDEYKENWTKEYYQFLVINPSMISVNDVDQEKAIEWIELHMAHKIKRKQIQQFGDNNPYEEATYILENGIAIHVHGLQFVDILFFDFEQYCEASDIAKGIRLSNS